MNDTKICSKCGETKSVGEFSKDRNRKDGLRSNCKSCVSEGNKVYRKANKEKVAERCKDWYENNKDKKADYDKAYRKENLAKVVESQKAYKRSNPDKCRSATAKRRTLKLQAFPQWARTGKHKDAIDAVYSEAKRLEDITGIPYHVDHIHPLKSKFVCGLHLAVNLRAVVAQVNLSKSNRFAPYVESEL